MAEAMVFLVKTPTTQYLEIRQPGSQQAIRVIHCSLPEGVELLHQLADTLYEAGALKSGDT